MTWGGDFWLDPTHTQPPQQASKQPRVQEAGPPMLRMSVHTHKCAPPPGMPQHQHQHACMLPHTRVRAPAHAGRHSGRVLSHSPSLHPALAGNLVPSANTRASQGGLKWGQGMSRGCWRSAWAQARPCEDSTPQDYNPTPAPPQQKDPPAGTEGSGAPASERGAISPLP